jgi:hypothetical protein
MTTPSVVADVVAPLVDQDVALVHVMFARHWGGSGMILIRVFTRLLMNCMTLACPFAESRPANRSANC